MKTTRCRHLAVASAFAVVAAIGLAACGDDDDDAAGNGNAFCDSLVAFNRAAFEIDVAEDASSEEVQAAGNQLIPLWDDVRNNAPEGLDDEMAPISSSIDALADGDATAFNADETFLAYTAFVGEAMDECDFESTTVTAVDYAFEDLPATMPSGTRVIELTNDSDAEDHELIAFRKHDPDQSIEEIFEMSDEEFEDAITFAGFVFAEAGESGRSLFSFEPGQYVAVCFIPVGGAEDGPPHFTQGMVTEFSVS